MTSVSTFIRFSDSNTCVSGDLIDSLTEAVVRPPDAVARSARVCNLVNEMCAAVEWLHGTTLSDAAGIELSSLRQLVVAAHHHQRRMRTSFAPMRQQSGGQYELA